MQKDDTINLIKELIEKTTVSAGEIQVTEETGERGKKTVWFSVEVSDPYHFSARGGEGLFALNHLVRRIIETRSPDLVEEILVDINGFQKKRVENVRAVAHMMAERARYFKSNIEVDPMSAFERRIVHEFLSDAADLRTESEGTGPGRRVVIKYIGSL
ncbi:hypothetical protein A2933_00675 [Candidatus Nomurabacteria bacterium RIFCSPLOWO2_01_FULL_46_18]|uniref:R3H domain-containing protein n=1 Tax=Candidatus Nomurabacteria bacterium RIFCSPLOWO2_01_FULL_46_18 TaxID=1801783 RepID=A0A1F6XEP0_9BACT|nr:MAG: hypothetical protein A2933_00675 [Candidatus Nomurabacteria bacterium RIFCSPLOWO2_01_FULL_46_18]